MTWEPGHRRCWVGQSPNQPESLEPFTPHQLSLGWAPPCTCPGLKAVAELPEACSQRSGEPGGALPPQSPLPKACFPEELGLRRLGSSPGLMIHTFWGLFTSPLGLKIQGPKHPAGPGFSTDCTMPLVGVLLTQAQARVGAEVLPDQ